jgi:hypothetical protein
LVQEYENSLRLIISMILGNDDNTDFRVTPERIEKWKEKREIERKKLNGILTEPRLLYYSDFYDLKTIVIKNWDKFILVLDEKKRFEVLFSEIENFRNAISHSRELLPYQENLIKGIVGDIKTQIIKYHNKNMEADDFFIKILKVSDSLGNSWDCTLPKDTYVSPLCLRVGDTFEIIVEAHDPKGREIFYSVQNKIARSELNKFTIEVEKHMVSKSQLFTITAFTKNDEYKNSESWYLFYPVIP